MHPDLGLWTLDFGRAADIGPAWAAIHQRWDCPAQTAVILGTGLGDLADEIAVEATISYADLPGFPRSTALAHKGRLVCGRLSGQPILMLQGRCHLYEGYSLAEITLPTRVLIALGIQTLIVTNAAGGLNPDYRVGDVMLIDDHINLMWLGASWPVAGKPSDLPPNRRVRMYDAALASSAEQIARRCNFPLRRGVYLAVTGPTYETRAEYRAFRRMGADCVGMSTVPEVLVAAKAGVRVLGLSTVTNVARPDAPETVSAQEVAQVAAAALPKVRAIIQGIV
jgi:purine-nucleoside phosphorylase